MLSILIPVYNFDITSLVKSLHRQSEESTVQYEIYCLDDASGNQYHEINRSVSSLPNVVYKRLEKNLGRSPIRNLMAREAHYENLLFMDCDSEVVGNDFVRTYIQLCDTQKVVCGGRVYSNKPPEDKKKMLRWKSGRKREEIPANVRNKKPYSSFMTNNFLISKKLFLENLFDESVSGYGHEDTLFGFQLQRKNVSVIHIDNPLRHIALEDTEEFLAKTENAVRNLFSMYCEGKLYATEINKIQLLNAYLILQKIFLAGFFLFIFNMFYAAVRKNILSLNPSLVLFDVYKLGILTRKAHG